MASETLPRLRAYRASDAPFVEELARSAFGEYSPRAGEPTRQAATAPDTVALVAVLEDEPVGFAMLTLHGAKRAASLDAIAVEAVQRGKGVGKLLIDGAIRAAKKQGAKELRLVTAEANVAALDAFLRAGFVITDRRERFYPRGQNAVSMKKTLR